MKKYSFLVYHKEYANFLEKLQELGVVHIIENVKDASNDTLAEYYRQLSDIGKTQKLLNKIDLSKAEKPAASGNHLPAEIVEIYINKQKELEKAESQLALLKKELIVSGPWGDFSLQTIKKLNDHNIDVFLFTCGEKKFNHEWLEMYPLEIINHEKGIFYLAYFRKRNGDLFDLPLDPHVFPERSGSEIKKDIEELENTIQSIKELFVSLAFEKDKLMPYKNEVQALYDQEKVKLNTQKTAEDRLLILEGWTPESKVKELESFLDQAGIYYFLTKPEAADKIPILLKNNRFSKLFEPIGKLFSLPAYMELDLTPFFAPFFMLFFGFCLGDAGYGVLLFLLATWFKRKIKPDFKPILTLVQWLGGATILMGLVSGTFFGVNLLDTGYILTDASFDMLRKSFVPTDVLNKAHALINQHFDTRDNFSKALKAALGGSEELFNRYKILFYKYSFSDYKILNNTRHLMLDSNKMFNLSLGIGLIQIIFGMCVKAMNLIRQRGFKYALSTIGWVLLIVGMITLTGLKMGAVIPENIFKLSTYILLGISGFFILIFNDPDANPFISVGKGLYDVYGMVTGVFGDLLSYIRLFALGTSGAILGFVINTVALNFLGTPYVGWLFFAIFLIIGHSLVIGLSVLGAFVHPMRLTFVEFYKNAGFAGGGKEYKPFKK